MYRKVSHLASNTRSHTRGVALKRLGAKSCNSFPTNSCKFPTCLQILMLPTNSPKLEDFEPQIVYFWIKIVLQEENFPTGHNCLGGGVAPVPWHDATGSYLLKYTVVHKNVLLLLYNNLSICR